MSFVALFRGPFEAASYRTSADGVNRSRNDLVDLPALFPSRLALFSPQE